MNKAADVLRYLDSITNSQLDGSLLIDTNNRIKRVRAKMRDSKLYLALVGEFSSGKSTFINALIGARLLKEAVTPTTACATYIQRGGRELRADVTFFNDKKFNTSSHDYRLLADYLLQKFSKTFFSLQKIIEALTSDQAIARTVKKLYLTIPDAKIPTSIVLIDTPGFNPGADSVANHHEITKYVVEHIADAALILTPQEQAMSASLSRFLRETLSRYLHRCIFVITKMDNLPIKDKTGTIAYARQRIISDLNVQTPDLYAESAITALPVKRIPDDKRDDWKYFQKKFRKFETSIWENLKTKKEIVLTEHINSLVKELVILCSQRLRAKQTAIKTDKQFLEGHRIENIQTICDQMVSNSSNAIGTMLSSFYISFCSAENKSKQRAESIINKGVMSVSRFKEEMMPSIRHAVEDEAKKPLSGMTTDLNQAIKQRVSTEIIKIQRAFESHYDRFPALRPKETLPKSDLIRFNTPNMPFSIALSIIDALERKEKRVTGGGAAGGAGIGFLIGGPLGAVIGAGIGAMVGAGASDQSDAMRASVKLAVNDEITSFFLSLKLKVNNEMKSINRRYKKLIRQFADDHIEQYGRTVEQLIIQQNQKIDFLGNQIKSLKSAIINLNSIQDDRDLDMTILKNKQQIRYI